MTRTTVVERASGPVLTASGHLLFVRDGALLSAPFDARSLKIAGDATPVLREVSVVRNRGVSAILTVSNNGTLVYAGTAAAESELVSVSRSGQEQLVLRVDRVAANPRLSPDGRQLMFEEIGGGLWLYDIAAPHAVAAHRWQHARRVSAVHARRPQRRLPIARAACSASRSMAAPSRRRSRAPRPVSSRPGSRRMARSCSTRRSRRRRPATSTGHPALGRQAPHGAVDAGVRRRRAAVARREVAGVRVERARRQRGVSAAVSRTRIGGSRSRRRAACTRSGIPRAARSSTAAEPG